MNVPERAKGLGVFLLVVVPTETKVLVLCRSSPHDVVVLRQGEAGGALHRDNLSINIHQLFKKGQSRGIK